MFPTNKSAGPDRFSGEFYKTYEQKLISILINFLQKIDEKEYFQTHFMRPALP